MEGDRLLPLFVQLDCSEPEGGDKYRRWRDPLESKTPFLVWRSTNMMLRHARVYLTVKWTNGVICR